MNHIEDKTIFVDEFSMVPNKLFIIQIIPGIQYQNMYVW